MALILAGPIAVGTRTEYCVAPIYRSDTDGFRPSDGDVALPELGLLLHTECFVALWNARPIPESSLGAELIRLPAAIARDINGAYWSGLVGDSVDSIKSRVGKPLHWWNREGHEFQRRELERWHSLSAQVYDNAPTPSAAVCNRITLVARGRLVEYDIDDVDRLTSAQMAVSETNLPVPRDVRYGRNAIYATLAVSMGMGIGLVKAPAVVSNPAARNWRFSLAKPESTVPAASAFDDDGLFS